MNNHDSTVAVMKHLKQGYGVEGINYELTDTFANVELFASDDRYSIYDTRWADAPDTATWGGVLGTLQWQNA